MVERHRLYEENDVICGSPVAFDRAAALYDPHTAESRLRFSRNRQPSAPGNK